MSLRALEFATRAVGDGVTSRPNAEYKMHENRASEIRTDVYPVPATEVCCRHGTTGSLWTCEAGKILRSTGGFSCPIRKLQQTRRYSAGAGRQSRELPTDNTRISPNHSNSPRI